MKFRRFFSVDSAKAIKAQKYGYLNAINYMAPADTGGEGNYCPDASPACKALCLGWFSGQASLVADLDEGSNAVRESRVEKIREFRHNRAGFMREMVVSIAREARKAAEEGLQICVRLNGATDISWEGIGLDLDEATAKRIGKEPGHYRNAFELFPEIQFVDYTKNARRFDRELPGNLHLTFSRAENNEAKAIELLSRGINVAVVFGCDFPETWNGFPVVDGDEHDLRHLDPRGGYVIALAPKGNRAKRDTSGFVVR